MADINAYCEAVGCSWCDAHGIDPEAYDPRDLENAVIDWDSCDDVAVDILNDYVFNRPHELYGYFDTIEGVDPTEEQVDKLIEVIRYRTI